VGVFAVGTGVLSVREATSCVMNASLNVGVGITVFVTACVTNGLAGSVAMAGMEGEVVGTPPSGVGVAYCPHNEAFPPQDASKKEAAIKALISRFTKLFR